MSSFSKVLGGNEAAPTLERGYRSQRGGVPLIRLLPEGHIPSPAGTPGGLAMPGQG